MGISFSKDGDDVVGTVTTSSIGAAPASHNHDDRYYTETEVDSLLADKQDSATAFDGQYSSLSGIPGTFPPSAHNHDDRYYTEGEVDSLLAGKQDSATAFDGAYASLSGIPSTFAPSAHTHSATDINAGTLADARIPNLNASKITAGTLPVARGGTGVASLTSGSFLRGNGTSAVSLRTPAQVKSDIDAMDKHFVVNNQTGASYTLTLADDGALVTRDNSSANTLTIPTNASVAFPVGTVINFVQTGAGVTTVVASAGVTLNGVVAGSAAVSKQYSVGSLVKLATDTWVVTGPVEDVE